MSKTNSNDSSAPERDSDSTRLLSNGNPNQGTNARFPFRLPRFRTATANPEPIIPNDDLDLGPEFGRNFDKYTGQKSLVLGLIDFALLTSNVGQLRMILGQGQGRSGTTTHRPGLDTFRSYVIYLLIASIVLQVK